MPECTIDDLEKAGQIFYGKRGGKYADAQHKIPWKDTGDQYGGTSHSGHVDDYDRSYNVTESDEAGRYDLHHHDMDVHDMDEADHLGSFPTVDSAKRAAEQHHKDYAKFKPGSKVTGERWLEDAPVGTSVKGTYTGTAYTKVPHRGYGDMWEDNTGDRVPGGRLSGVLRTAAEDMVSVKKPGVKKAMIGSTETTLEDLEKAAKACGPKHSKGGEYSDKEEPDLMKQEGADSDKEEDPEAEDEKMLAEAAGEGEDEEKSMCTKKAIESFDALCKAMGYDSSCCMSAPGLKAWGSTNKEADGSGMSTKASPKGKAPEPVCTFEAPGQKTWGSDSKEADGGAMKREASTYKSVYHHNLEVMVKANPDVAALVATFPDFYKG